MTDTAHARLGPSGWDWWSVCPGGPRLADHFPDLPSEYAAEGTAAHHVRERCLREDRDVTEFVGEEITVEGFTFEVKPEWVDFLQPGIDRLRDEGGTLLVEQRVDLSPWIPGSFGTADAIVIQDRRAIVDDLKFGRGVAVEAADNGQAMLYALGAWHEHLRHRPEVTEILVRIDQPRMPGGGSEWTISVSDLIKFGEIAAARAKATEDPDAPLVVSPKGCHFCRVVENGACPALHAFFFELLGLDPADMDLARVPTMPDIDQLTPEKRSFIIKHSKLFQKWLDGVHGVQLSEALAGQPTPGFKAVATEGNRTWKDPEAAEQFWLSKMPKREVYAMKLKSPAQMEAIAGTRNWKQAEAELIHRPQGKPALVPESDKRPALIPVVDLLDDLDDDSAALATSDEIDELI